MSWLAPVVREINADQSMTDYKRQFFVKNATPNALIKYEQKLGEGAVEKIQALWSQRYSGSDGWKTAVLDQGADFQVIGSSMEQIRFTDVQAAGENRIAAAGGVPAIIVGLKEGMDSATYSNYGQAMRRFADVTMRPNWRSACAALAKLVTAPDGCRLWYDTTDISALREGEKERADTMQVLAGAASTLLMAGYTADSITSALTAGDLTLLQHTGLLSVQLQAPGTTLTPPTKGTP
jgi:HK97 family phage portal protein